MAYTWAFEIGFGKYDYSVNIISLINIVNMISKSNTYFFQPMRNNLIYIMLKLYNSVYLISF